MTRGLEVGAGCETTGRRVRCSCVINSNSHTMSRDASMGTDGDVAQVKGAGSPEGRRLNCEALEAAGRRDTVRTMAGWDGRDSRETSCVCVCAVLAGRSSCAGSNIC